MPEEEAKDMELVEMVTTSELIAELSKRFTEILIVARGRAGMKNNIERRITACNGSPTLGRGLAEKAVRYFDDQIDQEIDSEFMLMEPSNGDEEDDEDDDKEVEGAKA